MATIATPALAQLPTSAETSDTLARFAPDLRKLILKLSTLGTKPIGTQSLAETRRGPSPADAVRAALRDESKDVAALAAASRVMKRDMTYPAIAGLQAVSIHTHANAGGVLALFVYIHSGRWVIADLDTHDRLPIALACETGAIVVSVGYCHAPENRSPAAPNDTFAA